MIDKKRAKFFDSLAVTQGHQQGSHGWDALHTLLYDLMAAGDAALDSLLQRVWSERPHVSDAHLITLMSISVKSLVLRDEKLREIFDGTAPRLHRRELLAEIVAQNSDSIGSLLTDRSNSFTGARRFLLPQLVIGNYAARHNIDRVRLLDIGTGIGLLPRQLNNEEVFGRFAPGLRWSPAALPWVKIPLEVRAGIDSHPLPSLEWVSSCYGPSEYYEDSFRELLWSLERTAGAAGDIDMKSLDMLDAEELGGLLRSRRFNVVTCNFVLFQYAEHIRDQVISVVLDNMARPGLFLSMEPSHDLKRQGSRITAYLPGQGGALHIADAEDAHFRGLITLHPEIAELVGAGPWGG